MRHAKAVQSEIRRLSAMDEVSPFTSLTLNLFPPLTPSPSPSPSVPRSPVSYSVPFPVSFSLSPSLSRCSVLSRDPLPQRHRPSSLLLSLFLPFTTFPALHCCRRATEKLSFPPSRAGACSLPCVMHDQPRPSDRHVCLCDLFSYDCRA